jgi:leucyl-tRNA synthetase
MEYRFREIEKKWQEWWKENKIYKVSNDSPKPKYYVLDMFPYPSGAGLHVGHPLGYIASDIYARFKRLKGFNVLHPMGYDAFGLPAEQYAIEHGIHPKESTEKNIDNFRKQLDNIGFSFDWDREVRTSDPKFYKWTQWIFLQLFHSFYNRQTRKAEPITNLTASFEKEGNSSHPIPNTQYPISSFTADEWRKFNEATQQDILMQYRLAYCGYGEVNWCEALGTVLANDEVVNGVSERGGHPVVKKTLRQWYLRITEYADRLLEGLHTVDFSESMKEMQTNWIGKSSGAEIEFSLTPGPSPGGEGREEPPTKKKLFKTADKTFWETLKTYSRENRKNQTEAEKTLWKRIRNNQLGVKVRRQHAIEGYITDFALLPVNLIIEIDGGYHNEEEQKMYDDIRAKCLNSVGLSLLRFTNEEVLGDVESVIDKIKSFIKKESSKQEQHVTPLSARRGVGGEVPKLRVYTTRPDTIFGVDFMVIAPEHELVEKITTSDHKQAVEEYIVYVKSRSERERMAEKKITGVFTGAYALHPFNGREIPIWISEYVLAGYGTGAIMAVPCGDQRDFLFAKHFNIPITNIIGPHYNGEEANATKDAVLENSDFINGMVMRDAIEVVIKKIEEKGIGVRKVNYKMRDAAFSRQRYWGEPFPVVWKGDTAYALDESELPVELPHMNELKPGPEAEGPLANLKEWVLIPTPSPQVEKGEARVPKYGVHTPVQYGLAKQMRKGHTEAEGKMWELLRSNNLGVKFRRQHPIESYIVDFICLQEKLVIEVDGGYHETDEQKSYDEIRTRTLNEIGFTVIRFANDEVINKTEEVKEKIKAKLAESANDSPLRLRRGAGGEGMLRREVNTMPGYAGSSWYFLRYMDPDNEKEFCSRKASDYWGQVDLYIGGTEHAVGHLLYSRMWTKCLYDLGLIGHDEPYKRLVNQGMIQGSSRFVYRVSITPSGGNRRGQIYVSKSHYEVISAIKNDVQKVADYLNKYISGIVTRVDTDSIVNINSIPVDVNIVDGVILDISAFRSKWPEGDDVVHFVLEEDSTYICGCEVEKMSKSKLNTVNPDDLVIKYGADTFRMYEMFLGPVEMSKPWDTKGIEGVHRFLKKLWRLFYDEVTGPIWTTSAPSPLERAGGEAPTDAELKVLHKTIKKIEEDTERFSFNTGVSAFMICVNELTDLKCHKKEIIEPLLILLAPYAPHIAEELWHELGNTTTVLDATFPQWNEKYLKETSKAYPVAINGKTRTELTLDLNATQQQVEELVLKDVVVLKWLEGKPPKKIIYVKNKMINVVV